MNPDIFRGPSRKSGGLNRGVMHLLIMGCAGLCIAIAGCAGGRAAAGSGQVNASGTGVPTAAAPALSGSWTGFLGDVATPVSRGTMGDEATIARIIDEGTRRNEVMNHLRYLTKEIGPRLTGSSGAKRANEWTRDQFRTWGLTAELEQWGTVQTVFNRGPSTGALLMSDAPRPSRRPGVTGTEAPPAPSSDLRVVRQMELTTLSWTRGTSGPVRGPVVRLPSTPEEFDRVKDSLKGAWILLPQTPARGMRETRARVSDQYTQRREAREKAASGTPVSELSARDRVALLDVAGYISTSRDERVWTGAISDWRTTPLDKVAPEVAVVVRLSDYDYMNSRIADGEKVYAEFDLKHELIAGPAPVFNTIAEIRGSDLPHEVVYVSAHLDSWDGPGSQGATDNGTGVVVSLEAARILMAAGAKPRRTIRFGLWTGEEQGLLGSDWHVQNRKSEWANWSACFNDDGGTNYQGGLAASTDAMAQTLAEITAPVNGLFFDSVDGKPLNVVIRRTRSLRLDGGSDHVSFNKVGVPGFFWSEVGRANYGFGWHTQNDKLDLAIPEYLKQSSTSTAIAAYRLASAPALLAREPLPVEEPKAPASAQVETPTK